MTFLVASLRQTKIGIRCDRGSVLGNPFHMENEAQRDAVVEGFRIYLDKVALRGIDPDIAATTIAKQRSLSLSSTWNAKTRSHFMNELHRIQSLSESGDVTLLCWCAPKRCHCDIIVNYLNYVISLTPSYK